MLRGRRRLMLGLVCGMTAELCVDSFAEGIGNIDDV